MTYVTKRIDVRLEHTVTYAKARHWHTSDARVDWMPSGAGPRERGAVQGGSLGGSKAEPWRDGLARSDVPNRWQLVDGRGSRLREQVIRRSPVIVRSTRQAAGSRDVVGAEHRGNRRWRASLE
jgi:hypothetical protein